MTQKDNILQELNELNSSLVSVTQQNVYTVPAGYFDGLVEQVLRRIKAMETTDAAEELAHLSPLLSKLPKTMPYQVPPRYFEELETSVVSSLLLADHSPGEELETISPLLSSLKKENPYTVPQRYFDNLIQKAPVEISEPQAKVVPMFRRKWFRFAAAAVVVGIIAAATFMFTNTEKVNPNDPVAVIKQSIKKVSTENLDEFIQMADEENLVASTDTKTQDIKDLVKDVPENQIQSLLDDTEVLDDAGSENAPADNDVMMN